VKVIKEEGLDLTKTPRDKMEKALHIYYEDVVETLVDTMRREISRAENLPKTDRALPIVLSGGTARPKGFRELFERTLRGRKFPVEISEIRISPDPLTSTARGAHIAAMLRLDERWLGEMTLDPRRDLAGMIGLAGPYDFLPFNDATLDAIFGTRDLSQTQPINFVRPNEPPVLLATGGADRTVSPSNTARLASRIRSGGGAVTDVIYPRIGHLGLIGAFAPPLRFLAPVLRDVVIYVERATLPQNADRTRSAAMPTQPQPVP
jgi:hypothetical protein